MLGINLKKVHELLLRSSQYHNIEPEAVKSNLRVQLMGKAKKAKNAAISANRKRRLLQEIYNESPSKLYKSSMRNTHSQGKWVP